MHTLCKKCICARACAHMQRCRNFFAMKLLRTYLVSCASIAESCGLLLPPAQLLSRLNPSPDAVRSKNPSKSMLAHDAVPGVVSHKHHSIIRVGADLIQFVYKSHSRLATELTHPQKSVFAIFRASFVIKAISIMCSASLLSFSSNNSAFIFIFFAAALAAALLGAKRTSALGVSPSPS